MLNPSDIPNVLSNAANLGSNSALARSNALSQLAFLSGSNDPFQNGSVFSSSSGGSLHLGEGIHIVTTGAGDDQIYVGSGNDQVYAGEGNNSLFLGEGFSVAVGGSGNDTIYGAAASDIVNAGKGNNTFYLGEGVNIAITGLGDDLIYAGAAADVIQAGDGNNTIYAAEGDNFVFTGTGSDLIYAGSGNDVIFSDAGNDTIYAAEGNNFISAGTGIDTIYAGSGSDRFELVTGEGSVTIIGFGSNDKIHLGEGLSSDALSFITQDGDTLIKAGDDLLATLKWTQLSSAAIDNAPVPISLKPLPTSPNPSFNVGSGVFTVGSTGQVEIDYLFDSGAYEGELALFSLSGLTAQPGSDEFIKEATRRALSDSELGHVVIRDRVEGARFHGSLNEFAFNAGNYTGVEPVVMRPGDLFGLMLIPNGTVQQVFNQDPGRETSQPLFSLTAGNLDNVQFVNISDTGNVYALEDLSINGESDFDYNDLVFQIRGATGQVTSLDQLIAAGVTQPQQDWRNSTLGQAIVDYAKPYASHSTPQIGETLSERVLAMLDQAADTQPTKVSFDSSTDQTNRSIINDWVKTATERLSRVTAEGQGIISGISSSLPDSQDTLYQQILGLYNGLSSDTDYLNAWKDYWGSEVGRLKTIITAQVSELRDTILGTDNYLYQWANYTANEINSTAAYLDEWTNYAESEIERIDSLLSRQINAVSDARGTPEYNSLVSQINTTTNGARETFWNDRDAKNTVVTQSVNVFEAFDNYRVSSVDKAWKDYLALNNEQSAILSSIQSQLSSLGQYVDSVLSEAWNQYQELDRIRLQVIDDAVNQANFLSYTWNDLTGDTQDLIDVWAKIASQPNNWYSPSATPDQKSGLPLIGIIDTEFWASNPDIDYSRVVLGKDRIGQDDNPLVEPFEGQGNPHGTQVLEIITATRSNGNGIDGINDRSPIWLGSALGSADWAQSLIEFVDAAIASKQPNAVVNLSFDLTQTNADGSVITRDELTPLERAALTYAQQNQILIVTAAGNQGAFLSALGQATKEFDNILVVGAADGWNRADYSSYGSIDYKHYGKGVDILAQGVASNGAVGTSIAAAKVTGAASLVWAANPELNYTQVSDVLKRTATDINKPGWDAETGVGLLNISAAANLAATVQAQPYTSPNLDAIQTALENKGIPEASWSDFYRFAYYQELEAKLAGQSWSAVEAIAGEREANLYDDFKEKVVKPVFDVFTPPPTSFGDSKPGGNKGGSSGSGGGGGLLGAISSGFNQATKVVSEGGNVLKQVNSDTAAAYSKGKNTLVERRNNIRDTVITGVTNLNKTVESTKAITKAALQSVETVANNSTSAVIETTSRINNSVEQYGDRIGDEARAVGDRIEDGAKDLKQLYDENQQYLILVNPGAVIGTAIAEGLINSVKEGEVGPVLDTLKRVPVLGTAVAGVEGLYNAAQGDWEKVLTNAIQSALAFYGLTNIPGLGAKFIDLYVSVAWELKDEDYKGAVAEVLDKFGVDGKYTDASGQERRVADVFVNSAWAMKDGDFREVIDAGLSTAGFAGADQFIDIAWGVKDGNYQKALTVGLQASGFSNLNIDTSKADAFVKSAFFLRDNQVGQVADQLLAVAGGNATQFTNSSWVQALRNGNPNDDQVAFGQGLSAVGFQNTNQWVEIAWDIKDKQYLDSLSTVFALGDFKQGKDWIDMAAALERNDYFNTLSTGFKIAGFEKGENLTKAALALRQGDPINAFYEGLSLIDGVGELVDAFKYLKDGEAKKAVPSMIEAAPKLAVLLPEFLL